MNFKAALQSAFSMPHENAPRIFCHDYDHTMYCATFQDLEKGGYQTLDGDLDLANVHLPLPEDEEGILEYKFPKFAATHFQGNATHTFIRRPLRQSLLALKNEGDELVS